MNDKDSDHCTPNNSNNIRIGRSPNIITRAWMRRLWRVTVPTRQTRQVQTNNEILREALAVARTNINKESK